MSLLASSPASSSMARVLCRLWSSSSAVVARSSSPVCVTPARSYSGRPPRMAHNQKPISTNSMTKVFPLFKNAKPYSPLSDEPVEPGDNIKPVFDIKFASLSTPTLLQSALDEAVRTADAYTPASFSALPLVTRISLERKLRVLHRGAKMINPVDRAAYFKQVDDSHRSQDELDQARREKARRDVESGRFKDQDEMEWEEWKGVCARDELPGVGREGVTGKEGERQRSEKEQRKLRNVFEKSALLRREIIEEMRFKNEGLAQGQEKIEKEGASR